MFPSVYSTYQLNIDLIMVYGSVRSIRYRVIVVLIMLIDCVFVSLSVDSIDLTAHLSSHANTV